MYGESILCSSNAELRKCGLWITLAIQMEKRYCVSKMTVVQYNSMWIECVSWKPQSIQTNWPSSSLVSHRLRSAQWCMWHSPTTIDLLMAVRPWLSYGKSKQQWRTLVWYCWICSGFDSNKNFCGNHLQLLPCVLFIACDRPRQCFNSAAHWIKRNLSIAHLILAHEEHVRRQQQYTLWMLCILRGVGFCQCVWRVGVHRRVRIEALSFVNLLIWNVLRCIILWSHYADTKLMEVWKCGFCCSWRTAFQKYTWTHYFIYVLLHYEHLEIFCI